MILLLYASNDIMMKTIVRCRLELYYQTTDCTVDLHLIIITCTATIIVAIKSLGCCLILLPKKQGTKYSIIVGRPQTPLDWLSFVWFLFKSSTFEKKKRVWNVFDIIVWLCYDSTTSTQQKKKERVSRSRKAGDTAHHSTNTRLNTQQGDPRPDRETLELAFDLRPHQTSREPFTTAYHSRVRIITYDRSHGRRAMMMTLSITNPYITAPPRKKTAIVSKDTFTHSVSTSTSIHPSLFYSLA